MGAYLKFYLMDKYYGPHTSLVEDLYSEHSCIDNVPNRYLQQQQQQEQYSDDAADSYSSSSSSSNEEGAMNNGNVHRDASVTGVSEDIKGDNDDGDGDAYVPRTMTYITSSGRPECKSKQRGDGSHPRSQYYDKEVAELRNQVDMIIGVPETQQYHPQIIRQVTMTFVSLGNTLIIRDRLLNLGGIDVQEMLWAYDEALKRLEVAKEIGVVSATPIMEQLACTVHSNKAEAYYMADMFAKSADSFSNALEERGCTLEARAKARYLRGTALMIQGRYKESAADYVAALEEDYRDVHFYRILEKLTRILSANESDVPGGWEYLNGVLRKVLPDVLTSVSVSRKNEDLRALQLIHLCLFLYNDQKENDLETAILHLKESQRLKQSFVIHDVDQKSLGAIFQQQTGVFTAEFFERFRSKNLFGSPSQVPVFVVGFPRSGTTLLERVFDAHPDIAGLGEHSVMQNAGPGIVDTIRKNPFVNNSKYFKETAVELIAEMYDRWSHQMTSLHVNAKNVKRPKHLIDKQNMNFNMVGAIHTLFPHALIINVARNPMDVVFSNYKHDFLGKDANGDDQDYTCSFSGLSKFYKDFRLKMEYWDRVLPGRITHIRYEDIVNDLPGVARALIELMDLEWKVIICFCIRFYGEKKTFI